MSGDNTPQTDFRQPRFWPAWLGIGFLWASAHCPHAVRIGIGRTLGWLLYVFARDRRHITEVNLALCFPELSAQEHARLTRRTLASNGIGLIETAFAWFCHPEGLRGRVRIEGQENLEAALQQGRGVILLGGHFTTLDLGGALLSLFHDVDVTYREHPNPLFNHFMLRGRRRLYTHVFERSEIRGMLRSLKRNRVVWYAPDQDYGPKVSVFAPFFGVPAASITATGRFAEMSGAAVVPFSHFRDPDDGHYLLRVEPALDDFPGPDPESSATRVNRWLESAIRTHPDQYMWVHRRFKTRPPGEPRPYRRKLVKIISQRRYEALCDAGEILVGRPGMPKVVRLEDGGYIKFFRHRKLISSSRIYPVGLRFVRNAIALRGMGVRAPLCDRLYRCRKPACDVVRYTGVPGEEVRDLVAAGETVWLDRLPAYLSSLHDKGIMFRAIHLANVLVTPEQEFALIDIGDLEIKRGPLHVLRRARNLLHLLNTQDDRPVFQSYGVKRFVDAYVAAWGIGGWRENLLRGYIRRNLEF